ncbi:hypothetical protein HD806DRAFT_102459 [Xylariaceae sp. AK1471]|nr:hypothetical protein HD806DRAFT_102459 [Xylariaceae sp. AK1471]
MNWLAPLKTAGVLALSALQLLARLLYVLSTPLRWPLYYIYAFVVFLLSPLTAMFRFGLGAVSFAINLVVRLKYLYIYLACAALIGICAGFVLHGTSSFIFVLLGVDTASERLKLRDQQYRKQVHRSQFSLDDEEAKEYDGELESASFSGDNSSKWERSSSSASWQHFGKTKDKMSIDPNDLFEKRWKLLRTPEPPRRRRKGGLLAQTIHEESSESDFS